MNKNTLPAAVLIIGLTAAFTVISILVYLTRGRESMIKRKLKIGAMLLTVTGIATNGCETTETTCYAPIPGNQIEVDADSTVGSRIYLNPAEEDSVKCEIKNRTSSEFSFRITDSTGMEVQTDNISAADGAFDEEQEIFYIPIPQSLTAGMYWLELFEKPVSEIDQNSFPFYRIELYIIKP